MNSENMALYQAESNITHVKHAERHPNMRSVRLYLPSEAKHLDSCKRQWWRIQIVYFLSA